MKKIASFAFVCLASAAFIAASPARAEESAASASYPQLHGTVLFEIQDDWGVSSDDPDAEVNTLYMTVEPYITLSLTEKLGIEMSLVVEPTRDPDAGEDTYFENEGLYAEELKAVYTGENFSLYGGKYNPNFGTAWDVTPGVYGVDFAEDYELTERIGLGGSLTFGGHTVSANTFFADTTFLSESAFVNRGRTDKSDGGISNTESLSSFSAALDSEKMAGFEGLNTHLGFRSQAEGDADVGFDRETGLVAGLTYEHGLNENTNVTFNAEWAGIRNLGGTSDDVDYWTGGVGLTLYENWNLAASYTSRNTDVDGGTDTDDDLAQISAGYAFDNGIGIDVGYKNTDEADVDTDTVGVLLIYNYEF